jgi:hypothetical protein
MKGQYTEEELINKGNFISSIKEFKEGYVVRLVGRTMNYYRKESDGSWTNYHCRTIRRIIL